MSEPARGLILDSGILQGMGRERTPSTPLTDWIRAEGQKGTRLVTIKEVMAECISVPVALLESLHILVEPSRSPHDPQGLLHSFSAGRRSVWFNDDLPRADRAVVAHAISEHYDIVTTDWAMKDGAFREFLKRLQRMPDRQLPIWRLPYIYVAARGLTH